MPSTRRYAVGLMLLGAVLIVVPLAVGPIAPQPYEYEIQETTADDLSSIDATRAPNVDSCTTTETRRCDFERWVANEGAVTLSDDRNENRTGTVEESRLVLLADHGYLRPVTTYHDNGTATYTHESVDEETVLDPAVVSEEHVQFDDTVIESIETGHSETDEPIELWENNRIVEYDGRYYEAAVVSHNSPTEPWYWTATRWGAVLVGFGLLIHGRRIDVRDAS